jgi:hypothetical protein
MTLPTPKKNEKYKHFVKRFLKDKKVQKEFPDIKRRFAIMASTWSKSR